MLPPLSEVTETEEDLAVKLKGFIRLRDGKKMKCADEKVDPDADTVVPSDCFARLLSATADDKEYEIMGHEGHPLSAGITGRGARWSSTCKRSCGHARAMALAS